MWFLIKSSVWLGLLFVALSFFSGERPANNGAGSTLQISDAFVAATGAYDYLSGLCGEKPEVCAKGAETMAALGQRARAGAIVAAELVYEKFGGDSKDTAASTATPSVGLAPPAAQTALDGQQLRDNTTVAMNRPMPYRPPVDDGEDGPVAQVATDRVTTGAIPLPTPRPAI